MPAAKDELIPIGEMAERSGVAPSALRFYESIGLMRSERTPGGHRLFRRSMLRRVAFVRIAQRLGLSLEEIGEALATLPADRTPTRAQWAKLSRSWRRRLDERIAALEGLRDDLTGLHRVRLPVAAAVPPVQPRRRRRRARHGPALPAGRRPEDVTAALPQRP